MSSTASDPAGAQTIVLIHGMCMTPLSWEHGSSHYSDCGQHRLAPAWLGLEAEPGQLRRDPSSLRNLSITTSSTTTSPREIDTHRLDRPA